MDSAIEIIVKVLLAAIIFWLFGRMALVFAWMVQPFLMGFLAGILVTLLFVLRLRR